MILPCIIHISYFDYDDGCSTRSLISLMMLFHDQYDIVCFLFICLFSFHLFMYIVFVYSYKSKIISLSKKKNYFYLKITFLKKIVILNALSIYLLNWFREVLVTSCVTHLKSCHRTYSSKKYLYIYLNIRQHFTV